MCSAGMAMAGAGLLVGAYGTYQEGEYAAEAGAYNQSLMNYQADLARQQGKVEADQYLNRASVFMGTQWANFGAMGGRLDEGTPAHVMATSMDQIKHDVEIIKWNADAAATSYINQGNMALFEGQTRQQASQIKAVSSLLSGGSRMYWAYQG
jgi:hypothetical protein